MAGNVYFVLGGVSSGKSAYAEQLTTRLGSNKIYVATARVLDDEMRAKVDTHKSSRDDDWTNIEAPRDVFSGLQTYGAGDVALVDCLTMLLTNHMMDASDLDQELDKFIADVRAFTGDIVIVSNEVGLGGIAETKLGRQFQREQGKWNQKVAAIADATVLIIAGQPVPLTGVMP